MSTRPTKERAHWTSEDESTLLLFLIDHKAEGDSGGFKKSTWNAAAINVNKNISKVEWRQEMLVRTNFEL